MNATTHDLLVGMSGGALPALVAFMSWLESLRNGRRVKRLEVTINGRLTELLELTKTDAYAAGRIAGVIAQKEASKSGEASTSPAEEVHVKT